MRINEKNFNCSSEFLECTTTIGYSQSFSLIYKIVSIIGFLINIILISNQFKKVKKGSGRKKSTMKKLLKILPILRCLASLYWIISSFFFNTAENIKKHPNLCSILALSYITILIFEFTFINCLLIQFKKINYNPIDGILKPNNHILLYKIVSLILGLGFSAFCYLYELIGRSPMMTCFINTDNISYKGFIFLIPVFCICFAIYQIIKGLYFSKMFITDKGIRKLYKKNSIYIIILFILYAPLIILFTISIIKKQTIKNSDMILSAVSFFSTTMTALIPFLISIVGLCQGINKIKCISDCIKAKKKKKLGSSMKRKYTLRSNYSSNCSNNYNNNGELSLTMMSDPFSWLENHVMAFFMRDILLGICTCLNESKNYDENIKIKKNDFSEILKHEINNENYNLNDQTVNTKDYLNIQIMEYAPKCFAYLRNLENIDINLMIESFLPKNNRQSIKQSQGKSGTFFISTDDNKYMVKTLKAEEFELIKQTFLDKYLNYITNNSDSLLCRLYGMYDVILDGGQEILIIVMRNVIGDFKDNLVVKYDLKGSTYKRESELNINTIDKAVMKDNNFSLAEKAFFLNQDTINKLRVIIKKDSEFLSKLQLMDYSLFVVKLTLSKNEIIDIFGDNINTIQENEIMQINKVLDIGNIIKKQGIKKDSGFGIGMTHDIRHYENYLFPALNKGTAYIFAIIDYFQTFNFYKYMEYEIKTRFKTKKQKNAISCVEPVTYSKRFINFFKDCTEVQKIMIFDDEGDDKKSEKSRGGGDCNSEQVKKKRRSQKEVEEPDEEGGLKINGIELLSADDNNTDKENCDITPSSI